MKLPSTTGGAVYLDQTLVPGQGKFPNHKCYPNALLAVSSSGVFVFARDTIQAGEEVTYNYGVGVDLDDNEGEEQGRDERVPCKCGSGPPYCDGFY